MKDPQPPGGHVSLSNKRGASPTAQGILFSLSSSSNLLLSSSWPCWRRLRLLCSTTSMPYPSFCLRLTALTDIACAELPPVTNSPASSNSAATSLVLNSGFATRRKFFIKTRCVRKLSFPGRLTKISGRVLEGVDACCISGWKVREDREESVGVIGGREGGKDDMNFM